MSKVRELHNKAMALAHLSVIARNSHDSQKAIELSREAYLFEFEAAELVPDLESSEPTRSILYRSAASLAYQSKEFHVAQKLIAKGLAGFPPPQVAQELMNLLDKVNFEYRLQSQGVVLAHDALLVLLHGQSVGFGTVFYDEFMHRIKSIRTIVVRTMERLMGANYQTSGKVAERFRPFIPALATEPPGSFGISIKLAVPQEGCQVNMFMTAENVIDEIMTGVELINDDKETELEKRIAQTGYYRNFVSMVRDIAPDGDKISQVGFSSSTRAVGLTKQRHAIEMSTSMGETDKAPTPIKIQGVLDYATSRKRSSIGLTSSEDGKPYNVIVEEGLDDLVRSYFGQTVLVTGLLQEGNIYLNDLESLGD
jgi:hypothetical protein